MTRGEAASLLRGAGLQLDRDASTHCCAPPRAGRRRFARRSRHSPTSPSPGPRRGALRRRRPARRGLPARRGPRRLGRGRAAVRRAAPPSSTCSPRRCATRSSSAPGSADMLARLRRSGFPLVALDRTGDRFRHHRLLADVASRRPGPLRRRARGAAAPPRQRVAHQRRRSPSAGSTMRSPPTRSSAPATWSGAACRARSSRARARRVEHWLSQFTDAQIARPPAAGPRGRRHGAHARPRRSRRALARPPRRRRRPRDRRRRRRARAALGRDGLERMAEDAEQAAALLAPESPCQALCELLRGVADHLRGDASGRGSARGRRAAGRRARPGIHALCLTNSR